MVNDQLITDFKKSIDAVRQHDEIEVTTLIDYLRMEYQDEDYVDEEARILYKEHNIFLPKGIRSYSCFPAKPLTLSWMSKSMPKIYGGFSLRELGSCFDFPENKYILYNDDAPKEMKEVLKNAYYFDVHPEVAGSMATLLVRENSSVPLSFWYLEDNSLFKMTIPLEGYLNALLLTKGMMHWQLFFCKYADNEYRGDLLNTLENVIDNLVFLFPDEDYDLLIKKLKMLT